MIARLLISPPLEKGASTREARLSQQFSAHALDRSGRRSPDRGHRWAIDRLVDLFPGARCGVRARFVSRRTTRAASESAELAARAAASADWNASRDASTACRAASRAACAMAPGRSVRVPG